MKTLIKHLFVTGGLPTFLAPHGGKDLFFFFLLLASKRAAMLKLRYYMFCLSRILVHHSKCTLKINTSYDGILSRSSLFPRSMQVNGIYFSCNGSKLDMFYISDVSLSSLYLKGYSLWIFSWIRQREGGKKRIPSPWRIKISSRNLARFLICAFFFVWSKVLSLRLEAL